MTGKPKPVRLTKARAEALLEVFRVGAKGIEDAVAVRLISDPPPDIDELRVLKAKDVELARARDAAQIIRERFVTGKEKKDPTTLF